MWYGKGPGVDRCGDVCKHGNSPAPRSMAACCCWPATTTAANPRPLPHQSEHAFIDCDDPGAESRRRAGIPRSRPARLGDVALFRLLGRLQGVAERSNQLGLGRCRSASRRDRRCPTDFEMPPGGLNIRWPDPLARHAGRCGCTATSSTPRSPMRAPTSSTASSSTARRARFGIVTSGKSYLDVRQALDDLGIDERMPREIGLRVYKVGMTWPLEPDGVRHFAEGLEEILVVEEKRPDHRVPAEGAALQLARRRAAARHRQVRRERRMDACRSAERADAGA